MGTGGVTVIWVMEGAYALVSSRIRRANRRNSVLHRYPIRTRIGAEVVVKGAILLHDHNDMSNLSTRIIKRSVGAQRSAIAISWGRRNLCRVLLRASTVICYA